jgi:Transcriptional regulator containing an amidase domain and an AraC-type DNA-binding HTH domain
MDRRIELVISLLENDTSRAWDTHTLAALVNLSASRFRHLFKHETGTSPRQYLRELRFRKAEVLLATTFLSLKEIAEAIGIVSVTHLMKDFKERHGITPREFRIAARMAVSNNLKRGATKRRKR